jgi:hypothetical protein
MKSIHNSHQELMAVSRFHASQSGALETMLIRERWLQDWTEGSLKRGITCAFPGEWAGMSRSQSFDVHPLNQRTRPSDAPHERIPEAFRVSG